MPAVEVVAPEKKRQPRPSAETESAPEAKAPAAAQQSSKPRAQGTAASGGQASGQNDVATSIVSATGTAVSVESSGSSVTTITSGEIDAQQRRTAPELLQSVPGVNVVQTNGPGGPTAVFMRGTNSNHSKVLIDGVDVSDPGSPNRAFDFGQLLTMDLDRVEVLRGPQSGLYGSDALGGVIVVYTKNGEKGPPVVQGLVEGGSFGTFNEAVGARGGVDRFSYAVNASHVYVGHVPVTPVEILPPGQVRVDNRFENWTYSGKFGLELSKELTFNFVGRYSQSDIGFIGDSYVFPIGFVPDATRSFAHQEQYSGRAEAVWDPFNGRVVSFFGVNYTDTARDYTTPTTPPAHYHGDRDKYDWRSVITLAPGTILTIGADQQTERFESADIIASEANTGVFGQLQLNPFGGFYLTGNLRFDDNENFGDATTWRFSPVYVIESSGTKLKANIGTAFKAPSLDQRFHDYPSFNFFANRNLRPEESTGWDAGFEQAIFNKRARFGAVYFH
ncbi:MAG: TonB-dependent receptor, partial [Proteobacteria bacterium]|nr:TonB-dependent receptor [Pseudomonadota bacterium]